MFWKWEGIKDVYEATAFKDFSLFSFFFHSFIFANFLCWILTTSLIFSVYFFLKVSNFPFGNNLQGLLCSIFIIRLKICSNFQQISVLIHLLLRSTGLTFQTYGGYGGWSSSCCWPLYSEDTEGDWSHLCDAEPWKVQKSIIIFKSLVEKIVDPPNKTVVMRGEVTFWRIGRVAGKMIRILSHQKIFLETNLALVWKSLKTGLLNK